MKSRLNYPSGYPGPGGLFFQSAKLLFLTALFVLAAVGPALAAGEGGDGSFADFGWRVVNFAVLAGLLFYLGAKQIKAFFLDRKKSVVNSLKEAQEARDRAEARYQDALARLAAADEEIAELSRLIEAQGRMEREKILAEANVMAQRIKAETGARMEQEFARLRLQLQQEAVTLSLELAEKLLRDKITLEDREKMVRDYLASLGKVAGKTGEYSQAMAR